MCCRVSVTSAGCHQRKAMNKMDNYDNDFVPELYTLSDEDGVEHTVEMLDYYDEGDDRYYAMVPYYEHPEDLINDSGELLILKSDYSTGEETLITIDDEDEFNRIGEIFMRRLEEFFDGDDEDVPADDGVSS